MVGTSPRRAQLLAEEAVSAAALERDKVAQSTALRALGLATRQLGDLLRAEQQMRSAVRAGQRSGQLQSEAEARMSLAFVLMDRGRIGGALAQADRAAAGLTGLPAARLASQRALILQRAGRLDEALAVYATALPVLKRHGDDLWEARLRNNRGLLQAYRGALALAEHDLVKNLELDREAGRHLDAAAAEGNIGFLAARRGDAPRALERYDAATATYDQHEAPNAQLLLDRSELLLSVGLVDEATENAHRAVAICLAGGNETDLAEAELAYAKAALADGRPDEAVEAARRAEQLFRRQARGAWALLARYVRLRAQEAAGQASRRSLASALSTADALAAAGWHVNELDARLVAARTALAIGDHEVGSEQLRRAARARSSGDVELRTRAWYAEALLRRSRDDGPGAQAALRAGLRGVERRRASLGATELRVHVTIHGAELARLGLQLAVAAGAPSQVLAWAERGRAGALHLRPVRPPRDPELAAALAELRRLSAEVDEALLDGERPRTLEARRRELEQVVVGASRTAAGGLHAPVSVPTVRALADALGDRALVEFAEVDGQLFAVTVRRGRSRLFSLGSLAAVSDELGALHFSLRRLALGFGSARSLAAAREAADRSLAVLDQLLLRPLAPEVDARPLVVVPSGALHGVPWTVLPTASAVPVTVAPSASIWLRADRLPRSRPDPRVLLAAGPGLDAADAEVRSLAELYPGSTVLVGTAATTERVLHELDGADVAHLSAHGRLRVDNPLFSALELADGQLTVYDLERLTDAPRTVLLPACQSGVPAVRAGDEVMGLVSALLALGSRQVVATVLSVPDHATATLMVAVHEGLGAGLEPAEALLSARARSDLADPAVFTAAAGCLAFGA